MVPGRPKMNVFLTSETDENESEVKVTQSCWATREANWYLYVFN